MKSGRGSKRVRAFCSQHNEALTIAAFCLSACEVFLTYRNFRIPDWNAAWSAIPMLGTFFAVSVALVACLMTLGAARVGWRIESNSALGVVALCAAAGPLLQLTLGYLFHQQWVFVPSALLIAGGCVCFLPELIRRLAAFGVSSAVRCSVVCCGVLLVVAPLSFLMPIELFLVFMSVVPLALWAYFCFSNFASSDAQIEAIPGQKVPSILLLTVLMAGVMEGVITAVNEAKMPQEMKAIVYSLGFVVAAVIMCIALLHLRGSFNTALFRMCFPLMAAGIALFVLSGSYALWSGSFVFLVGRQLLAATVLALVVYLIRYQQADYYLLTFGVVTGVLLGSFLGLTLFWFAGQAASPALLPSSFIVFLLLAVLVAALYLMHAASLHTRWGMTTVDDSAQQLGLTFEQSCLVLAERHNLTKREREIVVCMAHGKDKQAIAEALYISEGTVKVHARNIYHKLGIHSKQELITLVEKIEASIKE